MNLIASEPPLDGGSLAMIGGSDANRMILRAWRESSTEVAQIISVAEYQKPKPYWQHLPHQLSP